MPDPTQAAAPDPTELVATILDEGPIGMAAAARLLGTHRAGRPTHPSTLVRWHRAGVPLSGGGRLHLEAMTVAGRLMTSQPALVRFLAAQQHRTGPTGTPPSARARAHSRADEALRQMGC